MYRPHSYDELAEMLSPEALATLDRDKVYGIQWYNRVKWDRDDDGGPIQKTSKSREDWIPVPVADAGIPRELVDAARAAIKDNVRPSKAAGRYWPLKGIAYCTCGCRLSPRTVRQHKYYVCTRYLRDGKAACEYGKNWPAERLEGDVRQFVADLIQNPEVLRQSVHAEAERLKAELRRPEARIAGYTEQIDKLDKQRRNFQKQAAEELISLDDLRSQLAELDEQKQAAESALNDLQETRQRIDYLNELPDLVEEYLEELPRLMAAPIRQQQKPTEGLEVYEVTPETAPARSEVDTDAMARKYRELYDQLGLTVVKNPDGTTEINGNFGKEFSKECGSQRCTASATTS